MAAPRATLTQPVTPAMSIADDEAVFAKQDVLLYGSRIVDDVATIDNQAAAGDDLGMELTISTLLEGNFAKLAATPILPSLDAESYLALLFSLRDLCRPADGVQPLALSIRWELIRARSNEVLAQINRAYGSALALG